jgi:8-oxo-dGTP diphosphatase
MELMQNNNIDSLPVPTLGVSGIVFNNQKQVLLIQRNQPPAMGLWSIPGGKLEAGESLLEACQREIKEETGLDTEVKNIVAIVERRVEGFHYVIIDFLALLMNEENSQPIAHSDVSEARWVNLENLVDYDLVAGLAEIILRTYNIYNGGHIAGLYDVDATGSDYILPGINFA